MSTGLPKMPSSASGSDSPGGNALPIAPGMTSSPRLFRINSWHMPMVWFSASTTLIVFTLGRASPVPTSHDVVAVTGAMRSSHCMQEGISTCPAWRIRSTPSNARTTWDGGCAPIEGMWVSEIRPIFMRRRASSALFSQPDQPGLGNGFVVPPEMESYFFGELAIDVAVADVNVAVGLKTGLHVQQHVLGHPEIDRDTVTIPCLLLP